MIMARDKKAIKDPEDVEKIREKTSDDDDEDEDDG